MKGVCVVICNFNKKEFVVKAVSSVKDYAEDISDIIVVDNCSTDGSIDFLHTYHPDVEVITTNSNVGGSGGFSLGMKEAYTRGYEKIVLLDNDAQITEGCLQLMSSILDDKRIGVVGPAICNMAKPSLIQEVGSMIDVNECVFRLRHSGENYEHIASKTSSSYEPVDYVPACCLMTTREVLKRVGFFDIDFFLYWDDIDWCARVQEHGFLVVATTKARALHMGGGVNTKSLVPRYYYWRNKFYFFKKHSERFNRHAVKRNLRSYLIKNIYFQNTNGMTEMVEPIIKAMSDARDGKLGALDYGAFKERGTGKMELIASCIPPGGYNIELSDDVISDSSRKISLITLLSLFDEEKYQFNIVHDRRFFEMDNVSYNISFSASKLEFKTIKVLYHLEKLDLMKYDGTVIYTDLLLNVLPETIDPLHSLSLYQQILQVNDFIDTFFDAA